jgi:hypothetical protein
MSARTVSTPMNKEKVASGSRRPLLLRIGAWIMENIISTLLALVAAVFFIWVNGKQQEFDQLEDRINKD